MTRTRRPLAAVRLIALALLAAMSYSDPRSALIVLAILLASWPLSRLTSRLIRRS